MYIKTNHQFISTINLKQLYDCSHLVKTQDCPDVATTYRWQFQQIEFRHNLVKGDNDNIQHFVKQFFFGGFMMDWRYF